MSRYGNFSSSQIYKLMTLSTDKKSFGKPALGYIKQKQRELKLGRGTQKDSKSRPTSWGKFVELFVFNLLPMDYTHQSDRYYFHEELSNWVGAPDMLTKDKVCDIKCPYSLDSFCDMADLIIANDLEGFKKLHPDYYWQLVSNAILTAKNKAELIIYCPYRDELTEILLSVGEADEMMKNEIAWMNWANTEEFPYLLPDKYYKNLYQFEFEVPESDKILLYETVKKANAILNRNN